eukprot:Nk52_evm25s1737 gene=Nk52_evmTU25s1737
MPPKSPTGKVKRAKKDKNAPKRGISAFIFFGNEVRPKIKKQNPTAKVTEIASIIGKLWGELSDRDKVKFNKMAEADKARYRKEMETYVPPPPEKGKGKRAKKDPNAPKRACSAFMFFANDIRPALRQQNPDKMITEIASLIGARWRSLSPKHKQPYEKLQEQDKMRYEREMQKYQKMNNITPKKQQR